MQHQMTTALQPLTLNSLKDMVQDYEINYTSDFDDLYSKIDNLDQFFQTGKIFCNMLKYILGLAKIGYQGQLHSTKTKRKHRDESHKNKKITEFNVQLKSNRKQITIMIQQLV